MTDFLTSSDVKVLNAARTILERAKQAALSYDPNQTVGDARDQGYFAAFAGEAADAIFETLNVGRAYLGWPLSDEQVHNREEVTA